MNDAYESKGDSVVGSDVAAVDVRFGRKVGRTRVWSSVDGSKSVSSTASCVLIGAVDNEAMDGREGGAAAALVSGVAAAADDEALGDSINSERVRRGWSST